MCNDPNQNPVLHVWFARDKGANYGFCEVASIEALLYHTCMDKRELSATMMPHRCRVTRVGCVPVSIKRPSDATSPMGMVGNLAPVASLYVILQQGVQMNAGGMLALPAMQAR
eukprot:4904393-Amphidinium_carterae.3